MNVFGITHTGVVRAENQDAFRYETPEDGTELLTAVVCDGMGGARAGGLASAIAVDRFMSHAANSLDLRSSAADLELILTDAVRFANTAVYERAFSDFDCMGMGTTLVALLLCGKRAMLANVGDSRGYMFYRNRLRQVTRDHSLVAELVAKGRITPEEARVHPRRNIITRAVGVDASVRADLTETKFPPEGRFLLCSDGLTNVVTDGEIEHTLRERREPEDVCKALLQLALDRGAPDNVTVLVAQH